MSSEEMNRAEDFSAAESLIEGSEILKNDAYSRNVLRNEGVTDAGVKVDIGNFLAAREAILTGNDGKLNDLKSFDRTAVEQALVTNSLRPDMEHGSEM